MYLCYYAYTCDQSPLAAVVLFSLSLIQGLEVGPQLGLFKSSSLESLHNVMQHTIKRDMVDDGYDFRNRSTRHSFKRAVDRTIDGQAAEADEGGEQRGVDGKRGRERERERERERVEGQGEEERGDYYMCLAFSPQWTLTLSTRTPHQLSSATPRSQRKRDFP